jgi:CTP:molybdopterin cytidylyltransferase MocA
VSVVALILAAGQGSRLGGPKALLAWPGADGKERPLAIAHAEERLAHESKRALVVVRKPVMLKLLGWVRPQIDLVVSEADDALGPAGSIAVASSRLGDATFVVLTPVDAAPASKGAVKALLDALHVNEAALAARPRYGGRNGHPVVLRASALKRYTEPHPPILRDHLKDLGDKVIDVDVDDSGVILDLDTPADVMGRLGTLPKFLS